MSDQSSLYVIGHRKPDTDAICGAIALADLLQRTSHPSAMPARCGEVPPRTQWVLDQAGLDAPFLINHLDDLLTPPQLVLVDHNEFRQSVPGVENAEIIKVVDHHRLSGDIATREPIAFLNEPVGSSCTIIAREYRYNGITPSPQIATCLVAGLVSDTLLLTSPTTTDLDRDILPWVAGLAGINTNEFTENFFAVGSLLGSGTVEQILNTDRKEFEQDGKMLTIAQIEERGLGAFDSRREELELALQDLARSENYDLALLMMTDIKENNSMIIAAGEKSIIQSLPFEKRDATLFFGKGVCSRKKQVFPAAADAMAEAVTV